jgi:biopolymer transport protein ExbD
MRLRRHLLAEEDDSETGIDLAPMLDFVLNLLIFFIITAVFVKETGLTLSRPAPSNQEQKKLDEKGTLFVAVHSDGTISIEKRVIDPAAVRANVERFHAEKPEGPVVVVANNKSPTGILVRVMDQVRLGGVSNVSIAPSSSGD